MTDGVNTELSGEADDGLTPEDESSVEDVPETGKTVKIDVSHTMLEEEKTILASNESPDESDKDTRQLPQLDAAEDDASVTAVHEGAGGAPRVTAGPSTQSEAEDAVQPSPKVKQEVSESSLRAILRGFVPPNLWANPTRPSTGPAQTIQQPIPEMDELILPSVEDVPIETHVASQTARAEDYTTSTTDNVPVKEATESQQTVSFDQSSSARSEKLPTPQLQRVGTPPAHRTPTIPEHEVMADNEPSPNNHSPQVEAEVKTQTGALREHSSPFAQETATAPAIACEMAPPVTTPVTPLRTKTASPAGKPKTAEPRFAYKSFAAFATPSPERLRVQKRRKLPGSSLRHPNLKGILASLVTGSARRTSNRVSWCLPGEPGECVEGGADVLRTSRDVPSSPPPLKPLAELPTASNDKFAKHFSSVMKRTDGLRHRFRAAADTERLVESLCSSSLGVSGGPPPKSGAVHAREEHSGAVATGDGDAGAEHQDGSGARERTVSVEPMDMVEDMVREMGDFWQSWDVDAELDAARKTDITTARAGTQSQTSWR
ncbi:hypothetical protein ISF_03123 [Cordyceps fumosorosea ARSEF 2679]|uniref:Uncharacterized protein n=1 Tax=Cordyceps fumosorosea (strain ARSEF 2679) TaxID=1081104 RepID=A0A168BAL6_CORFA|nr:hypothetical protein ISF_03123 [Cordyceps fumosorosea ARSEF 2679]OAA69853.1 hypothetical protein ISF_03123 [Cordyceps fumosorosea ARSEF 2679]